MTRQYSALYKHSSIETHCLVERNYDDYRAFQVRLLEVFDRLSAYRT
jgi:hypothetical protein